MPQEPNHADDFPPGEIEQRGNLEQRFRRFFELSVDMLCVAGADGYFKMVNPSFERLGYAQHELLSRPFLDFVHADDRMATLEEIAKLANGIPTIYFENRYQCKNGSYRCLAWTCMPDSDGTLYAIARDITDRKKAEAELRSANESAEAAVKELEKFTYIVSHDLRAPLRSIDGFSRMILEDCFDKLDTEGKGYLERLRAATKRMGQMIEGVLALSRSGRGELELATVNISEIALSILKKIKENDPDRRMEFLIRDGLTLNTDRRLMTLALERLIQNAWKFTGNQAQAKIEIELSESDEAQILSVRDNGAGFDMANSDKLFGVFQRLHTESEFEGLGVGLAIVRRVVSRLGGRIWAVGAVGEGATFSFSVPKPNREFS